MFKKTNNSTKDNDKNIKRSKILTIILSVIFSVSCLLLIFYYVAVPLHIKRVNKPFIDAVYEERENINPDVLGVLRTATSEADYPIMQHEGDDMYYLRRGPDGKYSSSGSLFVMNGESLSPWTNVVTIHGHNMRNSTMFGTLQKYTDLPFLQDNPTFTITVKDKTMTWAIFGVCYISTEYQKNGFCPYNTKLESEEEFNEYVENVRKRTLFNSNIDVSYGDKIVMLSTCDKDYGKIRFVIFAKEIDPNETPIKSFSYTSNPACLQPI